MLSKALTFFKCLIFMCLHATAQVDFNAFPPVKHLYQNLKTVEQQKKIFFGQEFFNSFRFGVGIQDDPDFSDCKSVTGEHPAVLGQDFHYYLYKSLEERTIHKNAALHAFANGAVITFDFHIHAKHGGSYSYSDADKYLMYNIGNLDDSNGELTWYNEQLEEVLQIINVELQIPIVFRVFHEMNGNWFWWGTRAYGGSEAYIRLYRYTVNYLRARTNWLLFAWSPDKDLAENFYPGNNYVDIVGLDGYDMGEVNYYSSADMVTDLENLVDFASENDKIAVFSETGNRIKSPDENPDWWLTSVYNPIIESDRAWKIAWILTWINSNWASHPYVPTSLSSEEAKNRFIEFQQKDIILFGPDIQEISLYGSPNSVQKKLIDGNLFLYPNPTSGILNIKSNVSIRNIEIYSPSGVLLYNMEPMNQNEINLNVSDFTKGLYFINIETLYNSHFEMIVLERN